MTITMEMMKDMFRQILENSTTNHMGSISFLHLLNIARALQELNKACVVYRELKLSNILMDDADIGYD